MPLAPASMLWMSFSCPGTSMKLRTPPAARGCRRSRGRGRCRGPFLQAVAIDPGEGFDQGGLAWSMWPAVPIIMPDSLPPGVEAVELGHEAGFVAASRQRRSKCKASSRCGR